MNGKASLLLRRRPSVLRLHRNPNSHGKRSLSSHYYVSLSRNAIASQQRFHFRSLAKPSVYCSYNSTFTYNSCNYSTSSQALNRDSGLNLTGQATYPKDIEGPTGLPSRGDQVKRLSHSSPESPYDILVIGGGGVCLTLFLCLFSILFILLCVYIYIYIQR